jgi:hypothetical protein
MAGDKVSIPHSDFIDKLVKDPAAPPDTRLLTGFVGASTRADHIRIYSDAELTSWIDVPTDQVVHAARDGSSGAVLAPTYVWVRRNAEIAHTSNVKTRSGLLEGALVQAHLANAAAAAGPVGFPATQIPFFCQTHTSACAVTSAPVACPVTTTPSSCPVTSIPAACPNHTISPAVCPSQICHSQFGPCAQPLGFPATQIAFFCQTHVPSCQNITLTPNCIPPTSLTVCGTTMIHCAP